MEVRNDLAFMLSQQGVDAQSGDGGVAELHVVGVCDTGGRTLLTLVYICVIGIWENKNML